MFWKHFVSFFFQIESRIFKKHLRLCSGSIMATCERDESNSSSDMSGECVVIRSCEPCVRNNSSTTATVYCKICDELFCDQCNHLHKIFKLGKHDVVSIEDIDSVPVRVDMKGMDICLDHEEKIKFYCEDHSKLCCITCVFTHRQCDKFHDLVSLSPQKGQELHDLNERLLHISLDVNAYMVNCKQSETALDESIANSLKEVDEIKDRLVHLIQDVKQKLLKEASRIQAKEITKLRESNSVSSKITEEINKLLSFCKLILENGTNQQQYIAAKHLEVDLQKMETDLNEQRNAHQECTFKLAVPKELTLLIAREKDILNMNVMRDHKWSDTCMFLSTVAPLIQAASIKGGVAVVDDEAVGVLNRSQPFKLKLQVSLSLESTEDLKTSPLISGLSFMPDGRLVAVNSKKMECIILNGNLQRQGTPYHFQSNPKDVVCLSRFEIAVTVSNDVCLLSVCPKNLICMTRVISTSAQLFSICQILSSTMVVSTVNDTCAVRMVRLDGLQSDFDHVEFPGKKYTMGESKCTYVPSKNTLILTDKLAHTVYMYDTVKGTSKAVTNKEIKEPCGACVGPDDTVLVCSRLTNSIVHLTIRGDKLGTYPVDMTFPRTLCISADGTKLAVSNNSKLGKVLQIYTIEK